MVPYFSSDQYVYTVYKINNLNSSLRQGDTTIFAYEIISEPPHLFELSHIKVPEAHQVSVKIIIYISLRFCWLLTRLN
jgi:hypothetical protein